MKTWKKTLLTIAASTVTFNISAKPKIMGLDDPNRIKGSYIVVFKDSVGSKKNITKTITEKHGAKTKNTFSHALKRVGNDSDEILQKVN